MDRCPYCGAATRPEAKFCPNCGKRLVDAPAIQRMGNQPDYLAGLILYANNGNVLEEYSLGKLNIIIGRAPNCDIVLSKDKLVSRRHSIVRYDDGRYVLQDEGSANGTFVNGQRLKETTQYLLQNGDRIGIGEQTLVFRAYSSPPVYVEDLPTMGAGQAQQNAWGGWSRAEAASESKWGQAGGNWDQQQSPWGTAMPIQEPPPPIVSIGQPPIMPAPQPSISWPSQGDISRSGTLSDATNFASEPGASLLIPKCQVPTPSETDVRYSDVSFPGRAVVGRIEALRVAITRNPLSPQAVPLSLQLSADKDQPMEVDAYVVFSPLDFDLEGSNVERILVPPDADSAPVLFKLTPKTEGRKTLAVEFFQNARYLGRAELETTVSQKTQLPNRVSAQAMLEMRTTQVPPDLTILFDRVSVGNDKYYYRYRLLSPIRELNLWFDEFRSPETSITPQGFLEELFSLLNRMIWSGNVSENLFFERLKSIGVHLYSRLFPDDLKRLYWNTLRNKVKSIVILSFEAWIPWEIVRPFDPETKQVEDGFLCEKFDLTRWLVGSGFPDTLNLEQLGLIVSVSDLASAQLESEEIKRLLGAKVRDILSSSEEVYRLLCTNECSGLHFACHGTFNKDNPDLSTLFLEDGTWLSPIDIDGDRLAFGKAKPLVFLNACETGQSGYALTGMGGWAEAFVGRAKCSGFIGSIWKANDESACKFAIALYQNLLDGKTIAEAARQARMSIKQAGDPTWLSYTVYANPLAHLT